MRSASNELKEIIARSGGQHRIKLNITLVDETEILLDETKIWEGSLVLKSATSSSNGFDIGAAVASSLSFTINDLYEEYSNYEFYGAQVKLQIGMELASGSVEYIDFGIYTVTEIPSYDYGMVSLECLDNMWKLRKAYQSDLVYPASLFEIYAEICQKCSVLQGSADFDNSSYVVKNAPNMDDMTYIGMLTYVCQIACKYAKMDHLGRLVLDWYDTETLQSLIEGQDADNYVEINAFSSLDIGREYVEITGVKATEYDENAGIDDEVISYVSGEEGYLVGISGNPLIQPGYGSTVANYIANQLVGLRIFPYTASHLSNILLESGDVVKLVGRRKSYYTIATDIILSVGNFENSSCYAESPISNELPSSSAETKIYKQVKALVQREKTQRELAIENLANQLGASNGLFSTEDVQEDGSVIYYLHNKPTLEESTNVIKLTADALGLSTDGGETYPYGLDISGVATLSRIYTIGLDADYINTGSLVAKNESGDVVFSVNVDTGEIEIANITSLRIDIDNIYKNVDESTQQKIDTALNDYTKTDELDTAISETVDAKIDIAKSEVEDQINNLETDLKDANDAINEELSQIKTWIAVDQDGLLLGKTGNPIQLRIQNDKVVFLQNGLEVAWFTETVLNVEKLEAKTELTVGRLRITPRKNGSIDINMV